MNDVVNSVIEPTGDTGVGVDTPPDSGTINTDAPDASLDVSTDSGSSPPADSGASFFESLPDDWRTQMVQQAGYEDVDKHVKQLERVKDLGTLTKNYFEAQEKIRQGMKNAGLPDDATQEQVAEYRDANNIPLESSGYYDALDEGLVIGDDDKAVLDPILDIAHQNNVPADVMAQMITSQMQAYADEAKAVETNDALHQQEAQTALRQTWGNEFETNLNLAKKTLSDMPEGLRDELMNARFMDGKGVMNSPEFIAYMANTAKQINPQATIVANQNYATEKERYNELRGMMGDYNSEYWKGQNSDSLQKEFRDLDAKYGT